MLQGQDPTNGAGQEDLVLRRLPATPGDREQECYREGECRPPSDDRWSAHEYLLACCESVKRGRRGGTADPFDGKTQQQPHAEPAGEAEDRKRAEFQQFHWALTPPCPSSCRGAASVLPYPHLPCLTIVSPAKRQRPSWGGRGGASAAAGRHRRREPCGADPGPPAVARPPPPRTQY